MRIMRIVAAWFSLLVFTCSWVLAQDAPPRLEVFAEGTGSFLSKGAGSNGCACPAQFICPPCPPLSFTHGGGVFTGVHFRTGHDAIEVSYSYDSQTAQRHNRLDVFSLNYIRYLWTRSQVQPFATAGLGTDRFGGSTTASSGPQFAWNFGGGADVVLRRHLAIRLELRDYMTGPPDLGTGRSHDIVPSAGIVFRFK